MDEKLKKYTAHLDLNEGVSKKAILEVQRDMNFIFPEDYVSFLKVTNGAEGFIGESYIRLWKMEELLADNKEYLVSDYAPGLILFGSDGGGDAFGFNAREESSKIVGIPFIVMIWKDSFDCGHNFMEFLEFLYTCSLEETSIQTNSSNSRKTLHHNPQTVGKELHHIKPIKFGGSPSDPANIEIVTKAKHKKFCSFWNKTYRDLKL